MSVHGMLISKHEKLQQNNKMHIKNNTFNRIWFANMITNTNAVSFMFATNKILG